MDKIPNQKYVEIWPISFYNDDSINYQLEITGRILVALQPKYPLQYVVYLISEANSSTPFTLLIQLNQNRWWIMNIIHDGKLTL